MHRPKAKIFSPFAFLNMTQFLGALNDNIFKLVIVFLLIGVLGEQNSNTILALSGAIFVTPFLLFSIPMGTLADRFSKRNITVFTKILEVVIMSLGVLAFGYESVWGSYTVLFLMGTQSAIFGPSKYAVVPELVHEEQISRANGILTALTVAAMILGTFLATVLTTVTDRNWILIALVCVLIAVLGLAASICIGKTPPAGSEKRPSIRVITQVIHILMRVRKENYLFESLLGSSFFYLIGAYTQLNVITYAIESLGLTAVGGGYLFLTTAMGIAIGAFLAGLICGRQVELGLAPIALLGMSGFLYLLLALDFSLTAVVICLVILGTLGGLFLVPFDAYIQAASPSKERGENIAAGSFLSFVGVLIASGLIALLGNVIGLSAAQGFACIGALTLLVSLLLFYRLSDALVRLLARYYLRKVERELLPDEQMVFLIETGDLREGILSMITLQQRYMRFLVEHKVGWLSRLAKARTFDQKERARWWLTRGYSLTVLATRENREVAAYCEQLAATIGVRMSRSTSLQSVQSCGGSQRTS